MSTYALSGGSYLGTSIVSVILLRWLMKISATLHSSNRISYCSLSMIFFHHVLHF